MSEERFVFSVFVRYTRETPAGERIPYSQGDALTPPGLERLASQIAAGQVTFAQMDNETREDSLVMDIREGWGTVYIVKDVEHYYELISPEEPESEEPLNLTGNGPTPKKHATRDLDLLREAAAEFWKTGEPWGGCQWEHTIH